MTTRLSMASEYCRRGQIFKKKMTAYERYASPLEPIARDECVYLVVESVIDFGDMIEEEDEVVHTMLITDERGRTRIHYYHEKTLQDFERVL